MQLACMRFVLYFMFVCSEIAFLGAQLYKFGLIQSSMLGEYFSLLLLPNGDDGSSNSCSAGYVISLTTNLLLSLTALCLFIAWI